MIRRAEAKDLEGIKRLLNQVLLVHHKGRPDLFKEIGQKYTDAELLELFKNEERPIWVLTDDNDEVLGHCFCEIQVTEEGPAVYAKKSLYIDDLCVDENARRQGVGSRLYEFVKQYAADNGFYNVTLHAWECNPTAVEFYKSLGMQIQAYTMETVVGER